MRIARSAFTLFAVLALSGPAPASETCRASVQTASNTAQKYRNAIGKLPSACSKSASECASRKEHADLSLDATAVAHDVALLACKFQVGGGTTPPAQPGEIVITEVMAEPAMITFEGEWFEIKNISERTIDLKGLSIGHFEPAFPIVQSVVVPPGGFAVLGRLENPEWNGGVVVDYVYDLGFVLTNAGDVGRGLSLWNGDVLLDQVVYRSGSGRSWSLDPRYHDPELNDRFQRWCFSQLHYNSLDTGTPGSENETCPDA